jgi:hypothetical protein
MKKYTLLTLTLLIVSSNLFAYPSELQSLSRTFPVADSLTGKCTICHLPDFSDLNPFGLDYDESETDEELAALDSDNDGITNILELENGTLPGDESSN